MDQLQGVLPSEVRVPGHFPILLGDVDLRNMAVLIVLLIFVIPSLLTTGGFSSLLSSLLVFVFFFIPSAVVSMRLGQLYPVGGMYVWVFKVLGPTWDVLLGFFSSWWPLTLLNTFTIVVCVGFVQSLGTGLGQSWFAEPWQATMLTFVFLLLIWVATAIPLAVIRVLFRLAFYVYLSLIACMFVAACFWLLMGHTAQIAMSHPILQFGPGTLSCYALMLLSTLGIQLPMNLAHETHIPRSRYFVPSVVIIIVGYLVAWLAVAVVLPANSTTVFSLDNFGNMTLLFLAVFGGPFGQALSALATVVLVGFELVSTVAAYIAQSRGLVMLAMDRRLPAQLAAVPHGTPRWAMGAQMLFTSCCAVFLFILLPLWIPDPNLISLMGSVVGASALLVWALASFALFLMGIILVGKPIAVQEIPRKSQPSNLAVLWCSFAGFVAVLVAVVLVFAVPWTPLLTQGQWILSVALCTMAPLALGIIFSLLVPEPMDVWLEASKALKQHLAAAKGRMSIREKE